VSPPFDPDNHNTSIALLKLSVVSGGGRAVNTSYFRATVDQECSALQSLVKLGGVNAAGEFYAALLANAQRWGSFVERGSQLQLPDGDIRYRDTASSLLTMYLNTDRGLRPQYGGEFDTTSHVAYFHQSIGSDLTRALSTAGGKFWNTYNEYLPLDTLALCGALLEFGHTQEALQYLGYFFETRVCSKPEGCIDHTGCDRPQGCAGKPGSHPRLVPGGQIIYDVFGCDSDADYGRLIALYVQAVRYSGNMSWAQSMMPTIQAMASMVVLAKRADAVAAFPSGHVLHGIVPGSPEHDICGGPSYFFSINVWYVRGLLELGRLHEEYPSLTVNATLESLLIPSAEAWRADLRKAADFTAVKRADGRGLFFLHPVAGARYGLQTSKHALPPMQGGDEATCVERGTCFASMSAATPSGGSNQATNYANFRIFSETLLAGVLEERHELAIMNFREMHRGTLLGMTRFRDGLDDMPILGCECINASSFVR
jgi:hypothetical protein